MALPYSPTTPYSLFSYVTEVLVSISSLTPSKILSGLATKPVGSVYSGDSSDVDCKGFQVVPVEEQEDSAPFLYFNFFGIPRDTIGARGWVELRNGAAADYLDDKIGRSKYLAGLSPRRNRSYSTTPLRPQASHQVWAVPGMASVDSDTPPSQLKEKRSIAAEFAAYLGEMSQFAHCYLDLLRHQDDEGETDLLYVENVGGNDILSWNQLLLSRVTSVEEFQTTIENRFKVLRG